MSKTKVFQQVGALHPGKSVFDLSYEKVFTCDMGQLIPVMCDEMVPGDIFKMGCQALVRFQPLVAPIVHEINFYVHTFFVPYRLLWDDWEDFITGGEQGDDTSVMPTWIPASAGVSAVGTLWDYLGFPVDTDPDGAYPIDMPRRAYNLIYNEFYRDENFITEVAADNWLILNRAWEKDYFTSALPWQQRGVAPALPIVGTSFADFTGAFSALALDSNIGVSPAGSDFLTTQSTGAANTRALAAMNKNVVDLSAATPFEIADFRMAFQIQKWMERNARAGARYVEFLGAHFGVAPRDDRLQRPEYIGGTKSPVIISEVLQTSETDGTPQGNLAGHGISINNGYIGNYRANEFGLVMSIMSIMPRTKYQQGINRQWLRKSKYDFYFPEFANLSEQAILNAEIYATDVEAENIDLFGYQGMYDEMRVKQSMICGEMRTTFDYWHLSRQFAGPQAPVLNGEFLTCSPRKDIFAVPSDPGLIVQIANIVKAIRPIPFMSNPGLTDHN